MIDKTTADEWYIKIISEIEKRNMTLDHVLEYMKFEDECIKSGFTFKSLLKARERNEPKEVVEVPVGAICYYTCPVCGCTLYLNQNYCGDCGQSLDWGVKKIRAYEEILKIEKLRSAKSTEHR